MPIQKQHRWLYPFDWRQLSDVVRFQRAKGRCEGCGRPHGRLVYHLGDGRWWDDERGAWRSGHGRVLKGLPVLTQPVGGVIRTTRVVLATAHLDHDPSNNRSRNLKAFCQRCHMLNDRPEHQRRRWSGGASATGGCMSCFAVKATSSTRSASSGFTVKRS